MRLKNINHSNGSNGNHSNGGMNNGASDLRRCVVVVGSTGTGKSSTVAKVTGLPVKSGSGHKSITRVCDIYSMPGRDDLVWVDTTGWDDLDGQDDVEIFQSILQLINRHNLTSVRAILWTIHPGSIRQDNTLDKQAKLINQFADKEIWDNVIIVCKQAMNPEHEASGAIQAAYQFNSLAKLQVVGYRFLEDPTLSAAQKSVFEDDPEMRQKLNVLDDQIIFNSYRCLSCGVEGDRRLLPQFCHMKPQMVHPGDFLARHPLATEPFHPSQQFICEHPGHLTDRKFAGIECHACRTINETFYNIGCLCKQKARRYTCCKGEDNAKGCQERWACCRKPPGDDGCKTRYLCCKQDIATATKGCETVYSCCERSLSSDGCKKVCQKCNAEWGTASKDCFKTGHELVELI